MNTEFSSALSVSGPPSPQPSPPGEGEEPRTFPVEHSPTAGKMPAAPFTIPAAERIALPDAVRAAAMQKLSMLARIHAAPNKQAMCEKLSASMHGKRGFSAKTLDRLYREYLRAYDWRVVADKARAPELREGLALAGVRRGEFLEWAHGFLLLNQREKFLPRHRKLMERVELWRRTGRREYQIPGYATAPENAAGRPFPEGWTPCNLRRLVGASKFEKRAMGVGRAAAAEYRPLVLTSRAAMKIGQVFFFDDNEHDMKVRHLGSQGRVLRPLEFSCLDYFSGCFVANVFKPTRTCQQPV